jgi:hypothetical protein
MFNADGGDYSSNGDTWKWKKSINWARNQPIISLTLIELLVCCEFREERWVADIRQGVVNQDNFLRMRLLSLP